MGIVSVLLADTDAIQLIMIRQLTIPDPHRIDDMSRGTGVCNVIKVKSKSVITSRAVSSQLRDGGFPLVLTELSAQAGKA